MLINVLTFDIQCTPIYAQQTFYMNNERMLNLWTNFQSYLATIQLLTVQVKFSVN